MDYHLSIPGLHRESARAPVGSGESQTASRTCVRVDNTAILIGKPDFSFLMTGSRFDKSFTDGPDSSKMAGV